MSNTFARWARALDVAARRYETEIVTAVTLASYVGLAVLLCWGIQ